MASETSFTKITLGVACGILLAPLLLVAGCMACGAGIGFLGLVGSAIPGGPDPEGTIELRAIEITSTGDRSPIKITGEIHNGSPSLQSAIVVRVDWLDQDEEVVEQSRHLVVGGSEFLKPGTSRAFEIMSPASDRIESARYVIDDHPLAPALQGVQNHVQ